MIISCLWLLRQYCTRRIFRRNLVLYLCRLNQFYILKYECVSTTTSSRILPVPFIFILFPLASNPHHIYLVLILSCFSFSLGIHLVSVLMFSYGFFLQICSSHLILDRSFNTSFVIRLLGSPFSNSIALNTCLNHFPCAEFLVCSINLWWISTLYCVSSFYFSLIEFFRACIMHWMLHHFPLYLQSV